MLRSWKSSAQWWRGCRPRRTCSWWWQGWPAGWGTRAARRAACARAAWASGGRAVRARARAPCRTRGTSSCTAGAQCKSVSEQAHTLRGPWARIRRAQSERARRAVAHSERARGARGGPCRCARRAARTHAPPRDAKAVAALVLEQAQFGRALFRRMLLRGHRRAGAEPNLFGGAGRHGRGRRGGRGGAGRVCLGVALPARRGCCGHGS